MTTVLEQLACSTAKAAHSPTCMKANMGMPDSMAQPWQIKLARHHGQILLLICSRFGLVLF